MAAPTENDHITSKLEVYLKIYQNSVCAFTCPVYTAIVIFSVKYLQKKSGLKFHFVLCDINSKTRNTLPEGHIVLKKELLRNIDYDIVNEEEAACEVRRCCLPVVVRKSSSLVHSGLCSVLRVIVQFLDERRPEDGLKSLLGFRGSCLRACAEVSVWTKFCEIDFPYLMASASYQVQQISKEWPKEILKLENHFRQPAVIQNVGKRKREILVEKLKSLDMKVSKRNVKELTEKMKLIQFAGEIEKFSEENLNILTTVGKVANVSGISQLEHLYAEGTDFTLTDLILYPCIAYFLALNLERMKEDMEKIPQTLAWYKRMSTLDGITEALSSSGLPQVITDLDDTCMSGKTDMNDEYTLPNIHLRTDLKTKVKIKEGELQELLTYTQEGGICAEMHEHPCLGHLRLPWDNMPTAVHPIEGELPQSRLQRKCHQLESLAMAVKHIAKPGDVIVDFCSGGGHLGLLIAYLLPESKVLLVENKEESILRAVSRMEKLRLRNVALYQCNMDYFKGEFDIGVCLHACGVATDLVLQQCMDSGSNFVICPCCYGGIQMTHTMSYPRSDKFKKANIDYKTYTKLAHSADRAKEGKTFMNIIDHDRAEVAREHGYSVTLCSLDPLNCSPKNNLLIGVKTS